MAYIALWVHTGYHVTWYALCYVRGVVHVAKVRNPWFYVHRFYCMFFRGQHKHTHTHILLFAFMMLLQLLKTEREDWLMIINRLCIWCTSMISRVNLARRSWILTDWQQVSGLCMLCIRSSVHTTYISGYNLKIWNSIENVKFHILYLLFLFLSMDMQGKGTLVMLNWRQMFIFDIAGISINKRCVLEMAMVD